MSNGVTLTMEDLNSLRADLVTAHTSALLSPEKLKKEEWHSSADFVRKTCVRAAWAIHDFADLKRQLEAEQAKVAIAIDCLLGIAPFFMKKTISEYGAVMNTLAALQAPEDKPL